MATILGSPQAGIDWSHPRVTAMLKREADVARENPNYSSRITEDFAERFGSVSAEDPFGRNHDFVELYDQWARNKDRQMMSDLTGVSQQIGGTSNRLTAGSAVDYDALRRAQMQAMSMEEIRTTASNDTYQYKEEMFKSELHRRLRSSHPDLLEWAKKHARKENVHIWSIIAACCIDQMKHGSVKDKEPDALSDINAELNKIEEEKKNGGAVAEKGIEFDSKLPF